MHRKPYLTIGSLVYSAAYLIYGIYAAQAKHDLVLLCACTFFGAVGLVRIKNVWRDELGSYGGGSYRARGPWRYEGVMEEVVIELGGHYYLYI